MPIFVQNIAFQDDYTGAISGHGPDTSGVPQLMGCVGDFMYCKIDFYVAWSVLDTIFTFNSTAQTITIDNCGGTDSFIDAGFQVGDTIVVQGTAGNVDDGTYTIATLDDTVITVLEAISTTGVYANVNIYGATSINALDFYYNMVGNNDNQTFISLTDNKAVQRFTGLTNPLYYEHVYTLAPNATSQAWFNNTVDGVSCVPTITDTGLSVDYKQQFSLVFPFLITPFFLSNQLNTLQASYQEASTLPGQFVIPSYFLDQCLGFIYQIDAKFNIINTTADHSTAGNVTFNPGNTTWFDMFFPTGIKLGSSFINTVQYTFDNIVYTNASSVILDSIDINNPTNVSVNILHTGGGAMTSDTFVVNFMWLPTNQGAYQNYSNPDQTNFRQAFLHDRCRTHVGAGSANGDQFGTPIQAITNVVGTTITGGMNVTFKIDLGSLSKSTLTNANRDYLIWITPQSSVVTNLGDADRTAVMCDVNTGFINTDDSTLLSVIGSDLNFYQYPDTYVAYDSFTGFPGQYGLMKCDFLVKNGCVVENMSTNIIVEIVNRSDGSVAQSFPLTSFSNATNGYFDGNITQININQTQNFDLPAGSVYNTYSINRYPTLDTSTEYALEILYGFQIGYNWQQNLTQSAPMFLTYHTQYWPMYTQGYVNGNSSKSLWTSTQYSRIRMQQVWNVLDPATGNTTEFIQYGNIYAIDTIKGTNTTIDTQDGFGNSLQGQFANDSPTTIQAIVSGSSQPSGSTLEASITVSYNNGSGIVYDTLTSLDSGPETPTSLWTGILIVSQLDPTTVFISGVIDLSQSSFPVTNITVTATVWYVPGSTSDTYIVTDGGTNISDDSGNLFIVG